MILAHNRRVKKSRSGIKKRMIGRILVALVAGSLWSALLSAQSAVTVRTTELRQAPENSSAIVQSLKKEVPVTVLKRQGGWYEVMLSDQRKGWVKMISLRFLQAPQAGEMQPVIAARSNTTVATGVRGLSEGGLSGGSASAGRSIQMSRVQTYQASVEDVEQFAREARLVSKEIDYVE